MLLKGYESTKVDRRIGYMYPQGLFGPPAMTLTK